MARKAPEKLTTPPNPPDCITFFTRGGKARAKEKSKAKKKHPTQALALVLSFDLALDFAFLLPARNVMSVGRWSGVVCLARGLSSHGWRG